MLPPDNSEPDLLQLMARLNANDAEHGILVQLQQPAHIDVRRVLEAIDVNKDVDGFHLYNVGALATVVRYYGGVNLGAGGLVRAYTDCIAQALLGAEKTPFVRLATLPEPAGGPAGGAAR